MKLLVLLVAVICLSACNDKEDDLTGVYLCDKDYKIVLVKENNQYLAGEYFFDNLAVIGFLKRSGNYMLLPHKNNINYYQIDENKIKIIDAHGSYLEKTWCIKKYGAETAKLLMKDHL